MVKSFPNTRVTRLYKGAVPLGNRLLYLGSLDTCNNHVLAGNDTHPKPTCRGDILIPQVPGSGSGENQPEQYSATWFTSCRSLNRPLNKDWNLIFQGITQKIILWLGEPPKVGNTHRSESQIGDTLTCVQTSMPYQEKRRETSDRPFWPDYFWVLFFRKKRSEVNKFCTSWWKHRIIHHYKSCSIS